MQLSIAEWRRELLRFFNPEKNCYQSVEKKKIFQNFGQHIDDNLEKALNYLVADNIIIPIVSKEKTFYTINPKKLDGIIAELNSTPEGTSEIIQPYDKNFKNLIYQFETERDKANPNKGKYYHFTEINDNSSWVTIVKSKNGIKSTKLKDGSLNDPKSRLSRILKSIKKITNSSPSKTFIKKDIEDDEPAACGNNRQYSTAAFDIFLHEGIIQEVSSKGNSKYYCLGKEKHNVTLDELFAPLLKEQENENLPTNKISL